MSNLFSNDEIDLINGLLEEEETSLVREGSVVQGIARRIEGDRVMVDVGGKSDGLIPLSEFHGEEIELGKSYDVFVDSMDQEEGLLRLSKNKADQLKAWERVEQAFNDQEIVNGVITARVKGGLSVDINAVKAFLPGSQVDLRPIKQLDNLIGESFDFRIIKFNSRRGNIVLSRRVLLEEARAAQRAETLKTLEPDAVLKGQVKNITDYGAFIDLGGIDGLLHITDMTYGRLSHPREMVEVNQILDVKVLRFEEETNRVSLGLKQLRPNPWENVSQKYPVGCIVEGDVVSITDYGAFVELEEGIEGLVHQSEFSWDSRAQQRDPHRLFQEGTRVQAKVLEVDEEEQKISLSIKQTTDDPWSSIAERYPIGSRIIGRIKNITNFGLFVEIEENIDGLVHKSDLTWSSRDKDPSLSYAKGDEIEAKVTNINLADRRFSLSIRALTEDPWRGVDSRYFLGQTVTGTIVDHADFGLFVEIEDGIEGLVHVSELENGENWESTYPIGKELNVEITQILKQDRRIKLSERNASELKASGNTITQTESESSSLGALMQRFSKNLEGSEESESDSESDE